MPLRMTVAFSQDEYSWTEVFYLMSYSTFSGPALAKAAQYASLRAATLGVNAAIQEIRLSLVPANRQVYILRPPTIPSVGTWAATLVNSDSYFSDRAYSALLIGMTGLNAAPKKWFMAGIPDGILNSITPNTRGVNFGPAGLAFGPISALMTELTSGGYGYRARVPGVSTQAIGPLVTNAGYPGMVGVQVNANIGFSVGSQVLVGGWRRNNPRAPTVNGIWRVGGILAPTSPATSPWTYFLLNSGDVSPTNFKTIGTIGPLEYQYVTIQSAAFEKAVSHKRGASFGAPRGRLQPSR